MSGVEGRSAAYNSRDREQGRGGGRETGRGRVASFDIPLPRGKRHHINKHAYFREEETKRIFVVRRLTAFYMKNLGPRQTGREIEATMSGGKACSVEFEYSWLGYCPADALVLCHLVVRLHLSPYHIEYRGMDSRHVMCFRG